MVPLVRVPQQRKPDMVIAVPADVLTHDGAKPPAGTILTTKVNMFSSKFISSMMILY